MVPRNLENLRQLAKDWNIPSVNSGLIPGLPLFKFYASEDRGSGRVFKPLQLAWGLREEKDDMWGIGILPLVEIIGADKFPSGEADDKDVEILYGASPVRQPYKPGRGTGQQGEARMSQRQGDLARGDNHPLLSSPKHSCDQTTSVQMFVAFFPASGSSKSPKSQ